jgi:hypothetical protein
MWNFSHVIEIEFTADRSYRIVFDDGTQGVIDFSEYLDDGPVFGPLRNPDLFKRASIEGGTIAWPNGADIAPETLYQKCQESAPTSQLYVHANFVACAPKDHDRMPTISMFHGIIIRLYFGPDEHNPPHFHALYNEFAASIDIRTGE